MRRRNGNMTIGTLHVEHIRMEMAKIFQDVDRLGGTRAGTEGEGHLVSQSAMGIASARQEVLRYYSCGCGYGEGHISSRIPEMHLAKPTFGAVGV